MTGRPSTAASAISSAISEDDNPSVAYPSGTTSQGQPAILGGYTHLRSNTPTTTAHSRTSTALAPGAPSSTAGTSRPHSPVSTTSRTHVPSLTAHGFFRPMSSQRLQAQRLGWGRPTPRQQQQQSSTRSAAENDPVDYHNRGESISTVQHDRIAEDDRAPPSRGTEYTESLAPGGHTEFQGIPPMTISGDGAGLLMNPSGPAPQKSHSALQMKGQHLTLGNNYRNGVATDPPQKSPHSFRSNFSLRSQMQRRETGHEHLSSAATSPRYDMTKPLPLPPPAKEAPIAAGKNYQYFEGNTVFALGGRLQNARDRPVNIATGILVVLPAVLFFVFSWVKHFLYSLVDANIFQSSLAMAPRFTGYTNPLRLHILRLYVILHSCIGGRSWNSATQASSIPTRRPEPGRTRIGTTDQ